MYARKQGLNIIFAHLGYDNINDLWIEPETGIVDRYKRDLKICSDYDIPMVVMHVTSSFEAPKYNEIGLKRIKEICDYAKSLGIKVAIENVKLKGYQEYIMENIKDDNVGICFDAGHYHTFFKDDLDFSMFKNRIMAIHLHDNDQTFDQHLLPFDGTLDWDNIIKQLKDCCYEGPITLETYYVGDFIDYTKMSIDEYYTKAYEISLKIKERMVK